MLFGFRGLTAIVVSFCAALQPFCEPTGTTVSPTIWSTFGAGFPYGFGWPRYDWQSADCVGSSGSGSSSSARTSFSNGLWTAAVPAAVAAGVPIVTRASDP